MRSIAIRAALAALGSHVAFAAVAQVPTINIERTCGIAATAMLQLMGEGSVDSDRNYCLSSEQNARAQLAKDWATYPSQDRTRCVQPKVYLPSYVEWLTCLEMERDVRKMRVKYIDPLAPMTPPKLQPGTLR